MGPQVRTQIEIQRKALPANVTLVRLFSSVHQLVALELGVVEELFVAAIVGAAEKTLAVRDQVFAVCDQVIEHFQALLDLAHVFVGSVVPHNSNELLVQFVAKGVTPVISIRATSNQLAQICRGNSVEPLSILIDQLLRHSRIVWLHLGNPCGELRVQNHILVVLQRLWLLEADDVFRRASCETQAYALAWQELLVLF